METQPFWLEQSRPAVTPQGLDGVDVAIVGAGITGCAAPARSHVRASACASTTHAAWAKGQVGATAALPCAAPRPGTTSHARHTAPTRRGDLWRRTEAAVDHLESIAGDAFRRTGSLRLAADDEERVEIEGEYAALKEDGFAAEWRDELPHLRPDFRGAIFHPGDGAVQPAALVQRLATRR